MPEKIGEDSLVDVLAALHDRIYSMETIIVPKMQQKNELFWLQTLSHWPKAKVKTKKKSNRKFENNNYNEKKQEEKMH